MSQKSSRAPERANARAEVVNVNEGTTTESPGCRSSKRADSSSAEVHEVVSNTSSAPISTRSASPALTENSPDDEV